MTRQLTRLEYVILALIAREPASGYALRKSFATTPLGHFSDSPGSIYPALQRLRRRGLLRPLKEQPANARGKQRFTTTPKGLAVLRSWLKRPITGGEVLRNVDDLLLRFAFRAQMFGEASARTFLLELEKRVLETVHELESYLRGPGSTLPLTGRLAVEHGLEGYRTLARWAARAENELKRSKS